MWDFEGKYVGSLTYVRSFICYNILYEAKSAVRGCLDYWVLLQFKMLLLKLDNDCLNGFMYTFL